jgi:hypothetical protein
MVFVILAQILVLFARVKLSAKPVSQDSSSTMDNVLTLAHLEHMLLIILVKIVMKNASLAYPQLNVQVVNQDSHSHFPAVLRTVLKDTIKIKIFASHALITAIHAQVKLNVRNVTLVLSYPMVVVLRNAQQVPLQIKVNVMIANQHVLLVSPRTFAQIAEQAFLFTRVTATKNAQFPHIPKIRSATNVQLIATLVKIMKPATNAKMDMN